MYKASITAKKSLIVAIVMSAITASVNSISVDTANALAKIGVTVSPEVVFSGIVTIATAVLTGVKNWWKNRGRR